MKGWLGWGTSGTPTQLFWEGRLVTSQRGVCTSMNKFFIDDIKRLRNAIHAQTSDPLRKLKEATRGRQYSFRLSRVYQGSEKLICHRG